MPALARAIQEHPAITSFNSCGSFLYETFDTLCSGLATLPNLKHCTFYYQQRGREDVPTFQRSESVTDLLRAPSLRSMYFLELRIPRHICEAIAIALRHGSSITALTLSGCSFPEVGSEIIAIAPEENSSATTFAISLDDGDGSCYNAMASALLTNSTLRRLTFSSPEIIPSANVSP
jgi:hypothetical protein